MMIQEQKQMNANLNLEFDCEIEAEDPKPLIKVINYLINYLTPLATNTLEISLNSYRDKYMISYSVFTEHTELPPLSEQVSETLKLYNGSIETKFEAGKYIQIIMYIA